MGLISKVTAPVTALVVPAVQQPPPDPAPQPAQAEPAAEPAEPAVSVAPASNANAEGVVLAASQSGQPAATGAARPGDELPKGPPPARVPLSGYGPDATLDEARAGAEAAQRAYRQDQIIASVGVVAPTQSLAIAKSAAEAEAAPLAPETVKPWADALKAIRAA